MFETSAATQDVSDSNKDADALNSLRDMLHRNYGIKISDRQKYSLRSKLKRRMIRLGIDSISEYHNYLAGHPKETEPLMAEISTNKTFFFREKAHWRFLESKISSDSGGQRDFRIWSAACSTGPEVYSAAFTLSNYAPGVSYKILGTDISRPVLGTAVRGIYPQQELDKVKNYHPEYPRKYFEKNSEIDSEEWQVKKNIRRNTVFRYFNLRESNYYFKNKFDFILCRNVMIYFDNEMIEHVVNNLSRALKPGGFLFIGHTENLNTISHSLQRIKPAIYRKG